MIEVAQLRGKHFARIFAPLHSQSVEDLLLCLFELFVLYERTLHFFKSGLLFDLEFVLFVALDLHTQLLESLDKISLLSVQPLMQELVKWDLSDDFKLLLTQLEYLLFSELELVKDEGCQFFVLSQILRNLNLHDISHPS